MSAQLANLHERIAEADRRLPDLDARITELKRETVTHAEAQLAFADFDALWDSLIPREQARVLKLLISLVEYDAEAGTMSVTFRPTGIRALINRQLEEAA